MKHHRKATVLRDHRDQELKKKDKKHKILYKGYTLGWSVEFFFDRTEQGN